MRLAAEIALIILLSLVGIKKIQCDRLFDTPEEKWTCVCSAGTWNQGFIPPANCSKSCYCSQGETSADKWTCICAADGFPKVNTLTSNTSCFAACTCRFGITADEEIQYPRKQNSRKVALVILLLSIIVTVLALLASALCYLGRRDRYSTQRPLILFDKESSSNSSTNLMSRAISSGANYSDHKTSSSDPCSGCIPRVRFLSRNRTGVIHGTIVQFSYSELVTATNNFSQSNMIGIGGSSHVYQGYFKDGRIVAIKRIKTKGGPDEESIFLTEIQLISRLHHCHVVPLLGYCSEHQGKHAERLLVFEYMPNGNLRDCLDGVSGEYLDWGTRVAVALGAAKGLEYLHEAAAPKILHRDVKSTNILLDAKWRPKITDLGMAKQLLNEGGASGASSPARMQGTFGYFAPEYAIVGRASQKSDVFSFGVVLLELITGRQPIFKSAKGEESLVIWASPLLQDSKRVITDLPDTLLKGNYQNEELQVMAYLAKECLLMDPDSRPTMSEVVQILSTIAPRKSTRKNMSLQHFQDLDQPEVKEISSQIKVEEHCSHHASPQCGNCCHHHHEKGGHGVDIGSSSCRHCSLEADEAVDLTEPQFESF